MNEHPHKTGTSQFVERAVLPPTNKFVIAATKHEMDLDPAGFDERFLVHIGNIDSELARQIIIESKRLGTSNLSKEEIARQMAAWIHSVVEGQVAAGQLEEQIKLGAAVEQKTPVPAVVFIEPPATY